MNDYLRFTRILMELPWLICVSIIAAFIGPSIVQIPFIGPIFHILFLWPVPWLMPSTYTSMDTGTEIGFAWMTIQSNEAHAAYATAFAVTSLLWYILIRILFFILKGRHSD